MQNNVSTNVERIIAKIDNDFNPDNSDWIPRVGAWCIDAMSQLDVLRTKKTKKKVTVSDRIAYLECPINVDKVTDENMIISRDKVINNKFVIVRRGKKKYYVGTIK